MRMILGLFTFGVVVVIITQFAKSGSSGPNVVKNLLNNVAGYLSALK